MQKYSLYCKWRTKASSHTHPSLPSTLHTHTTHGEVRTHLPKEEMREERVGVEFGCVSILTPSTSIYRQGSPRFRAPKHPVHHFSTLGSQLGTSMWKGRMNRRKVGSADPRVRSNPCGLPSRCAFSGRLACGPLRRFQVYTMFWGGLDGLWALQSMCCTCGGAWFVEGCFTWIDEVMDPGESHVATSHWLELSGMDRRGVLSLHFLCI